MSMRQAQRGRLRHVPVGDCKTPVLIHRANITAPVAGVDFGRDMQDAKQWWCKVTTITGVTAFDSSNIEQVITHDFQGRFIPGIDRDMVIEHGGEYYLIITTENWEERGQFMRLRCTVRGAIATEVNKA